MLFPRTVAGGSAFCNRDDERARLKYNFDNHIHTLVMSPRRYGKTSLILRSLSEHKVNFAHIDWFLATKSDIMVERFVDGIAHLISKVMPINQKAVSFIQTVFSKLDISVAIYGATMKLKLARKDYSPIQVLRDAIEGVELILEKQKSSAVIFVDEIQDLLGSDFCDEMESVLRFYAQKSTVLTFIFSGSNRKLLKDMFEDSKRPMFNMCDKISLGRISAQSHTQFIQKAAKAKWKKPFEDSAIQTILNLTDNHSYFVNYLCSELWRLDAIPGKQKVEKVWVDICLAEQASVATDLSNLTINQKKILQLISKAGGLVSPTSKDVCYELELSPRGVTQSLESLIKLDYVEYRGKALYIVNPVMNYFLK